MVGAAPSSSGVRDRDRGSNQWRTVVCYNTLYSCATVQYNTVATEKNNATFNLTSGAPGQRRTVQLFINVLILLDVYRIK